MKELSIEEKAKAYDEALERARKAYNHSIEEGWDCDKGIYEAIFPELAESEEEIMLRKFKSYLDEEIETYTYDCRDEEDREKLKMFKYMYAWIEKQDDNHIVDNNEIVKPADKIQIGKKYKCIASPRYSTFMKGKTYKPEDKFVCSLMNFCSDCFEPIGDDVEL